MSNRRLIYSPWKNRALALAALLSIGPVAQAADPLDWPYWRGPEMNGVSRETNLPDRWTPNGENLIWKREDLGTRSSPIVMNGKMYTLCSYLPRTKKEGERVVCVDANTGETIWENRFNVFLTDCPRERVAWSAVVGDPETGRVYAIGVCGLFQCIDGETGKTIWSTSLLEDYGFLNTYGGRTNFPIVFEDTVIYSSVIIGWGEMAKPSHRVIGFDKMTGTPRWYISTKLFPDDTTYSAPVITTIGGQKQLLLGTGDGNVYGIQPRTGKIVWSYQASMRGINTAPLVEGETVILTQSEENIDDNTMGAVFAVNAKGGGDLTKSPSATLWKVKERMVGKSSPVILNDRLYAIDDFAKLFVFDAKSGEQIARQPMGTSQRASPVVADGKIYVGESNGRFFVFKPTPKGVQVVHQQRLNAGVDGSIAVSHGKLYIPTSEAIYCVGKKDAKPAATERPPQPEEAPVSADEKVAQIQVVPVEAIVRPSEKLKFEVRKFNSKGQFLGVAESPAFEAAGGGQISSGGEFTAPEGTGHHAVAVAAKVGDIVGKARIRVVPPFPWSFDFNDGQVPITWVGCRYRHVPLDFELFKKLEKEAPKASQLYILLMTDFANREVPTLRYEYRSAKTAISPIVQFLKLESAADIAGAKAQIDPILAVLGAEEVIGKWTWAEAPGNVIAVTIPRGPRKITTGGVMAKITTIPKGARSQGFMGQTDLHDYTIESDVYGQIKDGKMPDIALNAQRYTLDLQGAFQKLQIRNWPAQLDERMGKTIDFPWKPGVWYKMKMRVENQAGKAVVYGKVWERDQPEPAAWSIEASDEAPTNEGSPGLFGNAKDAEIFYDNIKVYPNSSGAAGG